jgi:hypothetical protein
MALRGIDYAGRSINYHFNRMRYDGRGALLDRLRRIAVGVYIEEAFSAYWSSQRGVSPGIQGRTHWREEDKLEFVVPNAQGQLVTVDVKGGHCYPSYRGEQRRFPYYFLDVEGLVPGDQIDKADVYVQAFLVAPQNNPAPIAPLIAVLPRALSDRWQRATQITVRAHPAPGAAIGLGILGEHAGMVGQPANSPGDYSEKVVVPPSGAVVTPTAFSSAQYILCRNAPPVDLEVSTWPSGPSHVVRSDKWYDLMLTRPEVYFAAWGTSEDFKGRRDPRPNPLPSGSPHKVYYKTRNANYWQYIRALRPMSAL